MRVEDQTATEAIQPRDRGFIERAMVRPVVSRHQLRATFRRERAERPTIGGADVRRAHAYLRARLLRVVGETFRVHDEARDLGA